MSTSSNSLATPARATVSLGACLVAPARSLAARAQCLWAAYWDHQARRATALALEALDDRALRDIGLRRSEILPAVFGESAGRARPYDSSWRKGVHPSAGLTRRVAVTDAE